jgi:hypothetical protein
MNFIKPIWYIVAGGPSLKNFNWDLLKGKNVIAVNRAYEVLPDADIIYFTDLRFWNWHHKNLVNVKGRLITVSENVEHNKIEKWTLTGKAGLDTRYHCLRSGNNSGYAAINLAFHMYAKTIILLGFDMKFSRDGACHWHEPHPVKTKESILSEKMLGYFDTISQPLKDLDITVINGNPDSAIKCFNKMKIEDIFKDEYSIRQHQTNV